MVIVLTCVSSVSFTYSAINIIHGADSSLLLSGHTVVLTTTTTGERVRRRKRQNRRKDTED